MKSASVDVAIVGAGLAGLSAAEALSDAGRSIIVLEADERVGGRTLNYDLGDGKVVEVGGQWVGPTQRHLIDLANRLAVDTYPTYTTGKSVAMLNGGRSIYRHVPRLSPFGLVESGLTLARLDRLARRVDIEYPWSDRRGLDELTMATWMHRHVHTRVPRAMLELLIENVFACAPADVSVLHVLTCVQSARGLGPMIRTRGGAEDARFVGGSQLLSLRLAERLGPGTVILSSPVRAIRHSSDRVEVETDHLVFTAGHAIVTVPPALAGRIAYDPLLPSSRDQLTQRTPMGSIIKCLAIYDEPFWRGDGFNGRAVSDRLAVHATFDNSPPDASPGIMLGFLAAGNAALAGASRRVRTPPRCLEFSRSVLRSTRRPPVPLPRDGLVGPRVDPRVLCGPLPPRHLDGVRGSSSRARWETALGRHGIGHELDRLHGRRRAIRPPSRGRGPRPILIRPMIRWPDTEGRSWTQPVSHVHAEGDHRDARWPARSHLDGTRLQRRATARKALRVALSHRAFRAIRGPRPSAS